jgi:Sec-independent protein translocase protein TatA
MAGSLGRGIQEFKEGLDTRGEPEKRHPEVLENGEKQASTKRESLSRETRIQSLHRGKEALGDRVSMFAATDVRFADDHNT